MFRMQEARKDRGWTRRDLAKEADLHPSDVGKFESGRSKPYESQLQKLAVALDLRIDELMLDVE